MRRPLTLILSCLCVFCSSLKTSEDLGIGRSHAQELVEFEIDLFDRTIQILIEKHSEVDIEHVGGANFLARAVVSRNQIMNIVRQSIKDRAMLDPCSFQLKEINASADISRGELFISMNLAGEEWACARVSVADFRSSRVAKRIVERPVFLQSVSDTVSIIVSVDNAKIDPLEVRVNFSQAEFPQTRAIGRWVQAELDGFFRSFIGELEGAAHGFFRDEEVFERNFAFQNLFHDGEYWIELRIN